MIARIRGNIIEREAKALVVEAGGLGYRVVVGADLWNTAKLGEEVTLRTYHRVSESDEALFGFVEQADLDVFLLLLSVPSVGPATAIRILDIAPPPVLRQAVTEQDTALLTKVSGVGKKTAQRILVELKGKLGEATERVVGLSGEVQNQAIEALTSIGFTGAQAKEAVGSLPSSVDTVEEAVRQVLQSKS